MIKLEIDQRAVQLINASDQTENIDAKITMLRDALAFHPISHPVRGSVLNNLAVAIHTRFKRAGDHSDLDEAIVLHREALDLLPAPNPYRPGLLNNLANAIQTRFEKAGDRSDLDEAIVLHREALNL